MTIGRTPPNADLFRSTRELCEPKLGATSMYRLLAEQGHWLFADEAFADLFEDVGRRSAPPRIVATVMVLQRFEGASDREAVERFAFDLRWRYAAGVDLDYPGFVHTVVVDMRSRLRNSERPNRIFEAALEIGQGRRPGGRKRVLDSTALYDAVATQDTVTMIRSAIRLLLQSAGALVGTLRAALQRDDDDTSAGKPTCDWDDDGCPMRSQCTASKEGRSVRLHPKHAVLDRARNRQRDQVWRALYLGTRPKVERKIAHLMRRKHGGWRARMRGRLRVGHDFALLAAAVNLARLAALWVGRLGARAD